MTLYYTLVFVILVTEMIAFMALIIPVPIPLRRKVLYFIRSSNKLVHVKYTLRFIFVFILILFIDAANRMTRLSTERADLTNNNQNIPTFNYDTAGGHTAAARFYAQRNLYLTGFTLFLSLILNRTFVLVFDYLEAEELLSRAREEGKTSSNSKADINKKDVQIAELKKELSKKEADLSALKSQCEGLTKEYNNIADRLNEKEGVRVENKKST